MAIKDLVPKFRHGRGNAVTNRNDWDPFRGFQREMNRMFEDFFSDFPAVAGGGSLVSATSFSPAVDISENDRELKVSVELPGMDESDISVELDSTTLTICGEKSEEKEDKNKKWHVREQSYGSFRRVIPLPAGAESDKAKAKFKKGVLTVMVPKVEVDETSGSRTIKIEKG